MRQGHMSEKQLVKEILSRGQRERWKSDYTGPEYHWTFCRYKYEFKNFGNTIALTMLFSYQSEMQWWMSMNKLECFI